MLVDFVADVCERIGATADVSGLVGVVSGFSVAGAVAARAVLEPLGRGYGVDATERDGAIVFRMRGDDVIAADAGRLVEEDGPALALASKSAVLNGANRALVESEAGWEMIQYLEAELVDVDTYQLTGLLRGQQGSENAISVGAAEGRGWRS